MPPASSFFCFFCGLDSQISSSTRLWGEGETNLGAARVILLFFCGLEGLWGIARSSCSPHHVESAEPPPSRCHKETAANVVHLRINDEVPEGVTVAVLPPNKEAEEDGHAEGIDVITAAGLWTATPLA